MESRQINIFILGDSKVGENKINFSIFKANILLPHSLIKAFQDSKKSKCLPR